MARTIRVILKLTPFQLSLLLSSVEQQNKDGNWAKQEKEIEAQQLEYMLREEVVNRDISQERYLNYQEDFKA